jgi:putative transposase
LGYSRQQYYKQKWDRQERLADEEQIRRLVCQQRKLLPRLGTRKLHQLISSELQQSGMKCGRDRLFGILRSSGLLIKPRKRYVQTTMSRHWMRKYPNLVRQLKPTAPEQIWVSDITYLRTEEGYSYLSLITDAYSRKIMGYTVSDSLDAEQSRRALQMALGNRCYPYRPLIHHSDRGHQYCSSEYVALAQAHHIRMSMTEHSDPYENALAERMNRTLKEEFCLSGRLPSRRVAALAVDQAVDLYNTYRPHLALNGQTPADVHKNPR